MEKMELIKQPNNIFDYHTKRQKGTTVHYLMLVTIFLGNFGEPFKEIKLSM